MHFLTRSSVTPPYIFLPKPWCSGEGVYLPFADADDSMLLTRHVILRALKTLYRTERLHDIGACLTIIILGYFALFVPPEQAANLPTVPDEGQYAFSAANLFSKGAYSVTLNHQDYPALYPYGFPLLLLPSFHLWGPFVGNVTYINFSLNMGAVILTYMLGRMMAGRAVGFIAALFLLGNNLFLHFSHRILTQGALACFFVLATLLLLKVRDQQDAALPLGLLGGLGGVTGWLSAIHASWICLDAAIVVALCVIYRRSRRKLIGALLVVGAIASALIAVQLEYNQRTFGNFPQSGYEYWNEVPAPRLFSAGRLLSFDFSLLDDPLTIPSFTRLRRFFSSNHLTYYVSSLLGLQPNSVMYSPAAAILIWLGAYELLRDRQGGRGRLLVFLTAATSGSLITLFVPYYFRDARFLIPVLPLLGVLASVGVVSVFNPDFRFTDPYISI
jgi:4-amino-4-deoxy-L-arabinose transferase-like glycosyltransferase